MRHIQRSILLVLCLTFLFPSFGGAQEEKQSSDLFIVIVNDNREFIDKTEKLLFSFKYPSEYAMVEDFRMVLLEFRKAEKTF